jgi:acetoin utilization deacetylase AcuC-like enzyme
VHDHRPGLILVSAGYDAHHADPLGSLRLDESAFVEMTEALGELEVPQVHVLEGGYDLDALRTCLTAVLSALQPGSDPGSAS